MRLLVMSDLHQEFDEFDFVKQLAERFRSNSTEQFDALVIAGDLHSSLPAAGEALNIVAAATDKPIVYVPGNHEYFTDCLPIAAMARLCAAVKPNVRVLSAFDPVDILGRRFLGDTFWYTTQVASKWRYEWPELRRCRPLYSNLEHMAPLARNGLSTHLTKGDIVVSHLLPSYACVSDFWKNSDTNELFVAEECTPLILDRQPSVWIHGHTHDSKDFYIGTTRVVCNPRGYAGRALNREFNDSLIIEV